MLPSLGWPKLWIDTSLSGKLYLSSIAQTAEMAAPRLCPVVTILAEGCLAKSEATFSVRIFSKNRQSVQNPAWMRQPGQRKYVTFSKLASQIQFIALLVPRNDRTTQSVLEWQPTQPAAFVIGCQIQNGSSMGIPLPVPHDHASTHALLQKAMAASLANSCEAVMLQAAGGSKSASAGDSKAKTNSAIILQIKYYRMQQ